MVKFKTTTEKTILDKRQKPIGDFIIRLIVNSIHADASGIVASGFYYYTDENGEEQVLDNFGTKIRWEQIEQAETELPAFDSQRLKEAFLQRIIEFTFIQQQMEDGENFGTSASDWERDVEYDNVLKRELNA